MRLPPFSRPRTALPDQDDIDEDDDDRHARPKRGRPIHPGRGQCGAGGHRSSLDDINAKADSVVISQLLAASERLARKGVR